MAKFYAIKEGYDSNNEEKIENIARKFNNKEIGQKLNITENTVKKHVSSIFTKLGFKSRKEVIS